jgi:hypothetical protein
MSVSTGGVPCFPRINPVHWKAKEWLVSFLLMAPFFICSFCSSLLGSDSDEPSNEQGDE